MGQISLNDIDNYGTSNSGSFFTLKDDGDKARIRLLYGGIDDLKPYVVHEVQIGDKRRYVNCLRDYNEPMDKCPLCAAGYKPIPKLFLKLYNEDTNECQIWERGKTYAQRIANLASHFNPLVNEIIEVTRFGKKGDMQTKYEFLPIEDSPTDIEQYDCAEPLGTIILDKNEAELNEFLDLGDFPNGSVEVAQQRSAGIERRTPSNTSAPRRAF